MREWKVFKPRPLQQEVLNYTGRKMGVSAVPGSGKTQTLSYLVAELIVRGVIGPDQEVLVVTLVNSAVDNFSHRVASFIQQRGLVPRIGYRVRTLHGLAHDIVRERPALAGLSDGFQIIDERAAEQILLGATAAWLSGNQHVIDEFLDPEIEGLSGERIRRREWPDLIKGLVRDLIRQAKDIQISPSELHLKLDEFNAAIPLLDMACAIYADYQRALTYRGAVDFNDLIGKALQALQSDPDYLARLRHRWPFILEDEAQDSSRLQEEILRLLSGPGGNWVRVGDPNQAIFETFTTASPQFMRDFLQESDVVARELPNSGRSTESIIKLANELINWTQNEHPLLSVRSALSVPYIKPSPPGDPQPNPVDSPEGIHLIDLMYTPQEEVQAVATSIEKWLPDHLDKTVAVLVPTNHRGFQLVNELKLRNIPIVEILRSTRPTREVAGALTLVLRYLSEPTSPRQLGKIYQVWRREERADEASNVRLARGFNLLRKCRWVEGYLWPRPDRDWLTNLQHELKDPELIGQLHDFRAMVQRWQRAMPLPIDQLILTLAQDLFSEPEDLAVTYKLAVFLRRVSDANPEWRLPEFAGELELIAMNERRFLGLSQDDLGFDPEQHKGEVVVATIHKAKGLEWDRVYLMSVNNYDFPSGEPHDTFISEKWFVRGRLNLQAELLAQLRAFLEDEPMASYKEGMATKQARLGYAAERLRLLYVGITRAKEELIITWNIGRRRDKKQSTPFVALQAFWEGIIDDPAD